MNTISWTIITIITTNTTTTPTLAPDIHHHTPPVTPTHRPPTHHPQPPHHVTDLPPIAMVTMLDMMPTSNQIVLPNN